MNSLEELCAIAEQEENGERGGLGPKKGVSWSETEHRLFLEGLNVLGKGNWRGISRQFVTTRSPTQVASHAQKYFLRLQGTTKRRSRFTALESRPHKTSAHATALRGSSPDGSSSPSSSEGGSGIAIPSSILETETSSKPYPIPLPPCLLSAAYAGGPSSLPPPFLFPGFNPSLMFGLPPLSSSPPSVGFPVPPLFFPSGSPPNTLPWMVIHPEGKVPVPTINLHQASIIKPSVARPDGSRGGLDTMLRSLSAGSLSTLGETPQVPLAMSGLTISAHSAFRPLGEVAFRPLGLRDATFA